MALYSLLVYNPSSTKKLTGYSAENFEADTQIIAGYFSGFSHFFSEVYGARPFKIELRSDKTSSNSDDVDEIMQIYQTLDFKLTKKFLPDNSYDPAIIEDLEKEFFIIHKDRHERVYVYDSIPKNIMETVKDNKLSFDDLLKKLEGEVESIKFMKFGEDDSILFRMNYADSYEVSESNPDARLVMALSYDKDDEMVESRNGIKLVSWALDSLKKILTEPVTVKEIKEINEKYDLKNYNKSFDKREDDELIDVIKILWDNSIEDTGRVDTIVGVTQARFIQLFKDYEAMRKKMLAERPWSTSIDTPSNIKSGKDEYGRVINDETKLSALGNAIVNFLYVNLDVYIPEMDRQKAFDYFNDFINEHRKRKGVQMDEIPTPKRSFKPKEISDEMEEYFSDLSYVKNKQTLEE